MKEELKLNEEVPKRAAANTLESFSLAMTSKACDAVVGRIGKNEEIATRYLNDSELEDAAFRALVQQICGEPKKSACDTMTCQTGRVSW